MQLIGKYTTVDCVGVFTYSGSFLNSTKNRNILYLFKVDKINGPVQGLTVMISIRSRKEAYVHLICVWK